VQAGAGHNHSQIISALKDDKENADTVKNHTFAVPADFPDQVEKNVMPNVDNQTLNNVTSAMDDQMQRFASGRPNIDGGNLLNAKNASSALYKSMQGPEEGRTAARCWRRATIPRTNLTGLGYRGRLQPTPDIQQNPLCQRTATTLRAADISDRAVD
jgi:hypothetical protein